jgi:hypothetical protein
MLIKNQIFSVPLLIILTIIIKTITAQGQWYYSLYLEQEYNSNPFGYPDPSEDQISRISMGLQKDWSKISMQYYGSYMNFYQNPARNLYWHQLHMGGGEQTSWSITAENRINRTEYNIYNYLKVRTGFNHNEQISNFTWRLGANGSINHFQQLTNLDNILLSTYTSLHRSFPSRSTLIGAITLNYKRYLKSEITEELPADSSMAILQSVTSVNQGGQGPGGDHGGGDGGGYYVYSSSAETPYAVQLMLSLRLAQSLLKYSGLAFQYHQRINLVNYDRNIAGLLPGYAIESQIFDDVMGYEARIFGVELTQLLPFRMTAKLAGYYHLKNYTLQGIYLDEENYDGTVLREDTFRTFWIALEKRLDLPLTESASLAIQLNYQWLHNNSNSYWYNYESQFISAGLQMDM